MTIECLYSVRHCISSNKIEYSGHTNNYKIRGKLITPTNKGMSHETSTFSSGTLEYKHLAEIPPEPMKNRDKGENCVILQGTVVSV